MTQTDGAAAVEAAAAPPPPSGPVVDVEGLSKRFGPTIALDGVDLVLRRGQVHGLVGANGAGKSTLIRILSGALVPDRGTVSIAGVPLRLGDPAASRSAGIVAVQQDIDAGVLPGHSVAQNLALDLLADPAAGVFLDDAGVRREAERIAHEGGLDLPLERSIDRLGAGDRQQVVLARALAQRPRLLILDEPTSALSERETGTLFRAIERMVAGGIAVLYVSHRLSEVATLADSVHVLRGGRTVAVMRRPFSGSAIGQAILGHAPVGVLRAASLHRRVAGESVLTLEAVATRRDGPRVDLAVASGEVVGLFGLIGAGKTSLLEGLFGVRPFASGSVRLHGRPYAPRDPAAAILRRSPRARGPRPARNPPDLVGGTQLEPAIPRPDPALRVHRRAARSDDGRSRRSADSASSRPGRRPRSGRSRAATSRRSWSVAG